MIVKYECESCGEEYDSSKCIGRCESCFDDVCEHCQEKGKDGNCYCEDCIEEANMEYEDENNIDDNEEESVF